MPGQSGSSNFLAKLGARAKQAHEAHKSDPVETGNQGLPEGIDNGVAQVNKLHFGEYKDGDNVGQLFFMAQAVVVEPKEHDGRRIEGRTTKVGPIPLCDTPKSKGKYKTFDQNYNRMLNVVKMLLGCDTEGGPAPPEFNEMPAAIAAIEAAAPHIAFRTWKGKPTKEFPNPRVTEEWNGLVQYGDGSPPSPTEGTDDQTGDGTGGGGESAETAETTEGESPADTFTEFEDLTGLAEAAAKNAPGAQAKLRKAAVDAGLDPKAVEDAESWEAVVQMILDTREGGESGEGSGEGEEGTTTEEEQPDPAKDEVYSFHPWDTKLKAPQKKAVQVKVTSVDRKSRTVNLTNMATKAQYKGIKYEDLKPAGK
jgi:hypothetical protein